jgi:putative ABC transport system permease protein
MTNWLRRARYWLQHDKVEADLSEEIEFHRQMKQEELEARGMSASEAAAESRRAIGNDLVARERSRDVWVWPWLQDITQDLRFGFRMLIKERRFALAAILTLALGIAVNNAVFTIINAALLRELPFERPDRLVAVRTHDARGFDYGLSYPDLIDFQAQSSTLETLAAHAGNTVNLSDDNPAERLTGNYVTPNLFRTLRTTPILGRDFTDGDNRPGAPGVAIIGFGLWQSRYAGQSSVLGRTVRANGVPVTIIGVMPENFGYPLAGEFWQPLEMLPRLHKMTRGDAPMGTVARLKDGASIAQAAAEAQTISTRIAQEHPDTSKDLKVSVVGLQNGQADGGAKFLYTLLGAVSLVLLIACANVANLMLARSAQRSREIAVRAAMGASRWRIVRQLLIECAIIAVVAGVLGLYLSYFGSNLMATAFDAVEIGAPDKARRPYWVNLSADSFTWMFLIGVCLFSTLAAGLIPALQLSRTNVNDVLKEGGRTGSGAPRARRLTTVFTVAQIALALIMLTSAALFVRNFMNLYMKDLVIDTRDVVTLRVALPQETYGSVDQKQAFFRKLDERLAGMSTWSASTIGSDIPLQPLGFGTRGLVIDGRESQAGEKPPQITYVNVGARYFETLGLRLTRGRALRADDSLAGREGAIVNERFAEKFFPGGDPLGQRIQMNSANDSNPALPWLTIVGVVPTLPNFFPDHMADPVVYAPLDADVNPSRVVSIIVRGPSKTLAATSLRDEVRALDSDLPVYAIQTLDEAVARSRWPVRVIGSWFLALALIAMTLAGVGLYAMTAHGVAQRAQEIGVRMAMGAQSGQVVWLFIRRTIIHVGIGVAAGLAGALAMSGLLRNIVREVDPRDPLSLLLVSAIVAVGALAACFLPARKAAKVDPVVALRAD